MQFLVVFSFFWFPEGMNICNISNPRESLTPLKNTANFCFICYHYVIEKHRRISQLQILFRYVKLDFSSSKFALHHQKIICKKCNVIPSNLLILFQITIISPLHLWMQKDAKMQILTALSKNGEGRGEIDQLSKNDSQNK